MDKQPKSSDKATHQTSVQQHDHTHEVRLALLNGLKLALSLLGTVAVAIVVRIVVPRYLQPGVFGQLSFADAYAATFFTFATFGVDTYIRKEVATRNEHANDFYAGFFVLRLLASLLIFCMMSAGLYGLNKGSLEWRLAFVFALGQVAYLDNYTLSAFLQAASKVNELAWANVAAKLFWGGGIVIGLFYGASVEWIALCFLLSEACKTAYLLYITHHRLHLTWVINVQATLAVLIASFPYYLNNMALRVYEKLNITMLSAMTNNVEVGWYSAAISIAGFSLLFLPVLQAVVMPMASRTAKQSIEAMHEIMRGGARMMVVCGTLIALLLALNAHTVAIYALGKDYEPSALVLQVLAPMFPLTYLATVGSLHLIQQQRIWTLIKISCLALFLNPLLNAPLIAWGYSMGPGKAGALSALATVCTEFITVAVNLAVLGRDAVDKRFWQVIGKTLLICGMVAIVHRLLANFVLWRIPIEGILYLMFAMLLNTLPVEQIKRMLFKARVNQKAS